MIAARLDTETENRLKALAKQTGRTKTSYVRNVILNRLEDLEDIYAVVKHTLCPGKKTYSSEEVKHELGL